MIETFAILTNKIHTFCKTYVITICFFQFFDYLCINKKPGTYSQPRQTSKMQLFAEIILRDFQLLTISAINVTLDVWLGSECNSENI